MNGGALPAGLEETVAVFGEADHPSEPLTTNEVAAHLDISRRSTYDRLQRLADRGLLETKKVGAKGRVWWANPDVTGATGTDGRGATVARARSDGAGAVDPTGTDSDLHTGSGEDTSVGTALERIDDGFFVVDANGRFTYLNDRAGQLFEQPPGELLGRHVREADPALDDEHFLDHLARAIDTQQSVTFEAFAQSRSTYFEVRAYPDETGLSVYVRDVTARKTREHDLEQYEALTRTATDVIVTIDADSVIRDVNPAVADVFGYEPGELVGESLAVLLADDFPEQHVDSLAAYLHDGDRTLDWEYVELPGVRADGTEIPLAISFSDYEYGDQRYFTGIIRDVSERQARERELERFETIVQTMTDGVYVMDADGHFVMVNDAFAEMTGYDRADLLGRHGSALVDEETIERVRSLERAMEAGERESARLEAVVERADGKTVTAEATFALVGDGDGPYQRVAVVRDVTERKARERALEESRRRYRTLVENFPNGAVGLVDDDLRYVTVGGNPVADSVETAADLEGRTVRSVLPDDVAEAFASRYEAALDGEASSFELQQEGGYAHIRIYPVRDEDGEVFAALGMSQDVTERRQYERELERRVRQQEVVTDLGRRALEDRDLDALLAEAAEHVAETLENDYCEVLDLDETAGGLQVREGAGWDEQLPGHVADADDQTDSQAAYTLSAAAPVVVEDHETESRFGRREHLADRDVRSGITVLIGSPSDPWGVLGTYDTGAGSFAEEDVTFVRSVATVLATAIDRHRHERELVRQREQLSAVNDLHEVVHGVTDAVLSQSTRDEIERTACQRLVDADSYEFAWMANVDPRSETVTQRVEAGLGEDVGASELTAGDASREGRGLVGTAVRTGQMQVCRDVFEESRCAPLREAAREHGFVGAAAIPVVHEGTQYGVIALYTARENAFSRAERAVVGQLGEVVGHAIAAAERKRALMSEEIVQLEFRVPDAFDVLEFGLESMGRFTFDQIVPVGDDEFLVYGHATADAVDAVRTCVEGLSYWESVEFGDEDDPVSFELKLSEPPVLSTLAALGGSVEEAAVEDGDYRMVLQLPSEGDAQRVVRIIQDAYDTAELMTRRQLTRRDEETGKIEVALDARLTDRQLASLRAAYHAGFFEWPRDTSGESLAESLDVSPPTFHQHLRKAERKVFDALLGDDSA